jgi:hypothetical protein
VHFRYDECVCEDQVPALEQPFGCPFRRRHGRLAEIETDDERAGLGLVIPHGSSFGALGILAPCRRGISQVSHTTVYGIS